jgi:hypothetical protein
MIRNCGTFFCINAFLSQNPEGKGYAVKVKPQFFSFLHETVALYLKNYKEMWPLRKMLSTVLKKYF